MLLRTYKRIILAKLFSLLGGVFLLGRYGRIQHTQETIPSTQQTIILLDLSTSMNTVDMPGGMSRLDAAKALIEQFASTTSTPLGLIWFQQHTKYLIPATTNKDLFLQKLSLLHTRSLGNTTHQLETSYLWAAVDYALKQSSSTSSFILISDFNLTVSPIDSRSLADYFPQHTPSFTVVALGEQQPLPMRDADNTQLAQLAIGRNDLLGNRIADLLKSNYTINPDLLTTSIALPTQKTQSTKWLLLLATLLLLLAL